MTLTIVKEGLVINDDLTLYIGDKYKIYFNKGNLNNEVIHIRKFVDNEYVVFKTWSKRGKHYRYHIEHVTYLKLLHENKNLILLKK